MSDLFVWLIRTRHIQPVATILSPDCALGQRKLREGPSCLTVHHNTLVDADSPSITRQQPPVITEYFLEGFTVYVSLTKSFVKFTVRYPAPLCPHLTSRGNAATTRALESIATPRQSRIHSQIPLCNTTFTYNADRS
jgi:hypothetical protein